MSKSATDSDLICEIWDHYRTHHKSAAKILKSGRKEYRLIKARLGEGYTIDDLKRAIDGYHRSPFHCGQNDRGTKYLTAALIFRDASHVQTGIELAGAVKSNGHQPRPLPALADSEPTGIQQSQREGLI